MEYSIYVTDLAIVDIKNILSFCNNYDSNYTTNWLLKLNKNFDKLRFLPTRCRLLKLNGVKVPLRQLICEKKASQYKVYFFYSR